MIAALRFKVNEECSIRIYPVGAFNDIDWAIEQECSLGNEYSVYKYKTPDSQTKSMAVEVGVDGNYVLRLIETRRYVLRMENKTIFDKLCPHFQNESNKFLKCERDESSITFQYINYLGRSKVVFGEGENMTTLSYEVIPDKMNYEEDYINLTEDLAQMCSALLLDYAGASSNVFEQKEDASKTVLEQFIFLRQFCYGQNLYSLFEAIKRNPERMLISEEEYKPIGYGQPSKKFYAAPFRYAKNWTKVDSGSVGIETYMPQEVSVTRKSDSIDTPANRFVKFALKRFDSICLAVMELIGNGELSTQAECVKEASVMHLMIESIMNEAFFDDVGELDIMPQNNQVLQKREGYSQIFSAYSMVDLALQLNWRGKDTAYEGESKNVALLYEYWLFFKLCNIIKSIDGCSAIITSDSPFITDTDGVSISLSQGMISCQAFQIPRLGVKVNLYYNRTFSKTEFRSTRYEGSYSRPFRPDYTIAIFTNEYSKGRYNGEIEAIEKGAVSYVHFDAKYRITDLTGIIGNDVDIKEDDELNEDKINSVVNTYKRGDLLKMHTYNDAIRRTIGSYVLYPGTDASCSQPKSKFCLFDEILPGIGAFAIKPSNSEQSEYELKRFITELIEAKQFNSSRLNRMKHYAEMVLREPKVSQKVISSKADNSSSKQERLGELCVLGYIRGDTQEDYYFSLLEKGLLKTGERFLFYFYAIKGTNVYSHHPNVFSAKKFRFYKNNLGTTNQYIIEPILCGVENNELISKGELISRLKLQGIDTSEEKHHADFYYVLSVIVLDDKCEGKIINISDVNAENGNDTFSPHSPKLIYEGEFD